MFALSFKVCIFSVPETRRLNLRPLSPCAKLLENEPKCLEMANSSTGNVFFFFVLPFSLGDLNLFFGIFHFPVSHWNNFQLLNFHIDVGHWKLSLQILLSVPKPSIWGQAFMAFHCFLLILSWPISGISISLFEFQDHSLIKKSHSIFHKSYKFRHLWLWICWFWKLYMGS